MTKRRERSAAAVVVVGLIAAACSGGDGESDVGRIEQGLRQIPLSVVEEVRDESRSLEIAVVDFAAVAEIRDLPEPQPGTDPDDAFLQLIALSGVGDEQPTVDVILYPEVLTNLRGAEDVRLVEEQVGLDVGAITSYSAVLASQVSFAAYAGNDSVSPSLVDVGDGVLSTYDGEDGEFDPDRIGPVDRIGRPVRVGQQEDVLAISVQREAIADWLESDETAADDEELLDAARALDEVGVVSAVMIESSFRFEARNVVGGTASPDELAEVNELVGPLLIDERFDLVAVGGAEVDGDDVLVAVYVFDDEPDAQAAQPQVDALWDDSTSLADERSIDELVDVVSVEQSGRTVTVIAEPSERSPVRLGVGLVSQRSVVFAHS